MSGLMQVTGQAMSERGSQLGPLSDSEPCHLHKAHFCSVQLSLVTCS